MLFSLVVQSPGATIVAYALALVVDCALFAWWVSLALAYSRRASRGETFALGAARVPVTRNLTSNR